MKMKNFEIEKFQIFRTQNIFSEFGPKLTVLLEIFIKLLRVKTW